MNATDIDRRVSAALARVDRAKAQDRLHLAKIYAQPAEILKAVQDIRRANEQIALGISTGN